MYYDLKVNRSTILNHIPTFKNFHKQTLYFNHKEKFKLHRVYIHNHGLDLSFFSLRGKLFGGTVPPNNTLFGGTVPPNNTLFGGTVPPNSTLFGGTHDSEK